LNLQKISHNYDFSYKKKLLVEANIENLKYSQMTDPILKGPAILKPGMNDSKTRKI